MLSLDTKFNLVREFCRESSLCWVADRLLKKTVGRGSTPSSRFVIVVDVEVLVLTSHFLVELRSRDDSLTIDESSDFLFSVTIRGDVWQRKRISINKNSSNSFFPFYDSLVITLRTSNYF